MEKCDGLLWWKARVGEILDSKASADYSDTREASEFGSCPHPV